MGTLSRLLDISELSLNGPVPRVDVHFQRAVLSQPHRLPKRWGLAVMKKYSGDLMSGKYCYTGYVDGVLATYGWVTFDQELIGELRMHIRLLPGEAYIWDCATLPEYRGLRLYPSLLWYIIGELRAQGLKRIWIGADADNVFLKWE